MSTHRDRNHITIPSELIDAVVVEVAQDDDKVSRNRTLAAIALGSWSLRHRAHKQLFASVILEGRYNYSATPRIRRLLELINSDPHSESTGIASYITSFTVNMTGRGSLVRPTVHDGTLATILRKLFKTGEPDSFPRSFSLTLGTLGRTHTTFDWLTLNADFLSAFHSLCRNPLFTTLHLSGFINLPANLLINSVVKSVKFSNIRLFGTEDFTFTEPSTFVSSSDEEEAMARTRSESPFREDQAVLLEAIETDHSFPILEVLDMTPRRTLSAKLVFSKLKSLTLQIQKEGDFDKTATMLEDAESSLEQLDVKLGYQDDSSEPLKYSELPALKSLTITHAVACFKSPQRSTIPQICNLLRQPQIPPTLQKIEVVIFLYTGLLDNTFSDIFDGYEYVILDELFSHPRFYSLRQLTIRFMFNLYLDKPVDERKFKAEASSYIRASFPEVTTVAENGPLDFEIAIAPLIRISARK